MLLLIMQLNQHILNVNKVRSIVVKNSYPKEFYEELIKKRIIIIYKTDIKSSKIYRLISYMVTELNANLKDQM